MLIRCVSLAVCVAAFATHGAAAARFSAAAGPRGAISSRRQLPPVNRSVLLPDTHGGRRADRDPEAAEKIRLMFSKLDLDDSSKFCAGAANKNVYSNFDKTELFCTYETDNLTRERKRVIADELLPDAKRVIQALLPVKNKHRVWEFQWLNRCFDFAIPAEHRRGVKRDVLIYVSSQPATPGMLAEAKMCENDADGRPTAGGINIHPNIVAMAGSKREATLTIVHEIMHVLGFDGDNFGTKIPTKEVERRGMTVKLLTGPASLRESKRYFGCDDDALAGIELEDDGGGASKGHHVERRLFFNDIMSSISHFSVITRITLAVFEDLGYYGVNYSALDTPGDSLLSSTLPDGSAPMGRGGTCAFLTGDDVCKKQPAVAAELAIPGDSAEVVSSRSVLEANLAKWFCQDAKWRGVSAYRNVDACADDFHAPVGCTVLHHASRCQARTSVILRNDAWKCGMPMTVLTESFLDDRGWFHEAGSKCFMTAGFKAKSYARSTDAGPRCLVSRCRGAERVQFRLPSAAGLDQWVDCPAGGSVTPSADSLYEGTVSCPDDAAAFCAQHEAWTAENEAAAAVADSEFETAMRKYRAEQAGKKSMEDARLKEAAAKADRLKVEKQAAANAEADRLKEAAANAERLKEAAANAEADRLKEAEAKAEAGRLKEAAAKANRLKAEKQAADKAEAATLKEAAAKAERLKEAAAKAERLKEAEAKAEADRLKEAEAKAEAGRLKEAAAKANRLKAEREATAKAEAGRLKEAAAKADRLKAEKQAADNAEAARLKEAEAKAEAARLKEAEAKAEAYRLKAEKQNSGGAPGSEERSVSAAEPNNTDADAAVPSVKSMSSRSLSPLMRVLLSVFIILVLSS